MSRVKFGKITEDFAVFTATLWVVVAILWGLHINVPIAYLNFMLVCLIILGVFGLVLSIRYFKKPYTRKNQTYRGNNSKEVRKTTTHEDVINPNAPSNNKSNSNDFHSRVTSFLTKVTGRYIK